MKYVVCVFALALCALAWAEEAKPEPAEENQELAGDESHWGHRRYGGYGGYGYGRGYGGYGHGYGHHRGYYRGKRDVEAVSTDAAADLLEGENRHHGYGRRHYGGYGHYRGGYGHGGYRHGYGHGHYRGKRDVEAVEQPAVADNAEQVEGAESHFRHRGYYGGYGHRGYGGYYGGYPSYGYGYGRRYYW